MADLLLFTVVDAFMLSGRAGPVLVPGLPQDDRLPVMRVGAALRLALPDGTSIHTAIAGFERISYGRKVPRDKVCTPISLPADVPKAAIVPGTEVYLVTGKSAARDAGSPP